MLPHCLGILVHTHIGGANITWPPKDKPLQTTHNDGCCSTPKHCRRRRHPPIGRGVSISPALRNKTTQRLTQFPAITDRRLVQHSKPVKSSETGEWISWPGCWGFCRNCVLFKSFQRAIGIPSRFPVFRAAFSGERMRGTCPPPIGLFGRHVTI